MKSLLTNCYYETGINLTLILELTLPFGATCIVQPSGSPSVFMVLFAGALAELDPLAPLPASGTEIELDLVEAAVDVAEVDPDVVDGAGAGEDSPSIVKVCVRSMYEESLSLTGLVETEADAFGLVSSILIWTRRL